MEKIWRHKIKIICIWEKFNTCSSINTYIFRIKIDNIYIFLLNNQVIALYNKVMVSRYVL